MTTTTIVNQKYLVNSSVNLDVGQTSGQFTVNIPFVAEYIAVLNDTIATISIEIGETFQTSSNAQVFTQGKFISMPLVQPTQKLTVFWSSDTAIGSTNNLVQFYFSNVTIPLSGGNYGSTSTNQDVTVMNTVTTQFASTPNVNVVSNVPIPTGTNAIGTVGVTALPALPAGTNAIGTVGVTALPSLPSGTNEIGIVKKEANTASVLTKSSAAITTTTTSADIDVSKLTELALDVNLSALSGTSPTYQLTVNRKGLDGVYYPLYTGSTESAAAKISVSLGHPNNQSLGNFIQVVETITGTTPSITRSMSIIGK